MKKSARAEKPKEVYPMRLGEKKQEISQSMPSVSELASLAATLAHGRAINQVSGGQLAREALELSKACSEQRQKAIELQASREVSRENAAAEKARIPKPDEYPVTFNEFLRLLIGGRYRANREKIYRDYAKAMIYEGHLRALTNPTNPAEALPYEEALKRARPASHDEVESWMKDAKKLVFKSEERYLMHARAFLDWWKRQPTERGRKAATKRWSQARRHKTYAKKIRRALLT